MVSETPLYPNVRRAIAEHPWAILPHVLSAMLEVVELRASGLRFTAEEIEQRVGALGRPERRATGTVAVLPLFGIVAQRMDLFSEMSGGTSTERFAAAFREVVNDPAVGAVVLEVDSPGGSVFGVGELAEEIRGARGTKPIVAVANSLAASAAYWIATAADELVVTPGGQVGSIGVIAAHTDESGWQEKVGVRTTLIYAGTYKAEGNPYEPLGDEARGAAQQMVDGYYDMFVRAVARQRGVGVDTVRTGFGEGRVVGAREAVRLGMADRVETMAETLARLSSSQRRAATPAAQAVAPAAVDGDLDRRRRRRRLEQGALAPGGRV